MCWLECHRASLSSILFPLSRPDPLVIEYPCCFPGGPPSIPIRQPLPTHCRLETIRGDGYPIQPAEQRGRTLSPSEQSRYPQTRRPRSRMRRGPDKTCKRQVRARRQTPASDITTHTSDPKRGQAEAGFNASQSYGRLHYIILRDRRAAGTSA
ncbi:hypothetical protein VUR80DRAFT_6288 [Thermomyces stellatus]